MPAPEAGHVLKPPDDVVPAHQSKQEHIEGEGGGTHITVPENESAEQTGVGAVRGIVEIAVKPADVARNRLDIEIGYRVRTTNTFYNLVFPFYLEEGRE